MEILIKAVSKLPSRRVKRCSYCHKSTYQSSPDKVMQFMVICFEQVHNRAMLNGTCGFRAAYYWLFHGPLTRYAKLQVAHAGNVFPRRRFQRKPLVSHHGMHQGTCVHVPWCMSGSLTCGDGENVPSIPSACAPAILRIWQEAHRKIATSKLLPCWGSCRV